MKQSNDTKDNLTQQLQQLPQLVMPRDLFTDIQGELQQGVFFRRHKLFSSISLLAVFALTIMLYMQNDSIDEKDLLIQELVKRTIQMQQLLQEEEPIYTVAGSVITERIVNIEAYLVKLDESINQSKDKLLTTQLMAAKLDLLSDLVLLQRKIQQKPDYQKVKPLII